ncbi:hypothetical protein LXA43DRAFT_1069690 [Ganoderma leucocontextum]|nr:hypothetical protein LXA43DRAFT_1069690 [Ganoderma leucocontextum]
MSSQCARKSMQFPLALKTEVEIVLRVFVDLDLTLLTSQTRRPSRWWCCRVCSSTGGIHMIEHWCRHLVRLQQGLKSPVVSWDMFDSRQKSCWLSVASATVINWNIGCHMTGVDPGLDMNYVTPTGLIQPRFKQARQSYLLADTPFLAYGTANELMTTRSTSLGADVRHTVSHCRANCSHTTIGGGADGASYGNGLYQSAPGHGQRLKGFSTHATVRVAIKLERHCSRTASGLCLTYGGDRGPHKQASTHRRGPSEVLECSMLMPRRFIYGNFLFRYSDWQSHIIQDERSEHELRVHELIVYRDHVCPPTATPCIRTADDLGVEKAPRNVSGCRQLREAAKAMVYTRMLWFEDGLLLTLDKNDAYFRLLQNVIDVLLAYMEKERETTVALLPSSYSESVILHLDCTPYYYGWSLRLRIPDNSARYCNRRNDVRDRDLLCQVRRVYNRQVPLVTCKARPGPKAPARARPGRAQAHEEQETGFGRRLKLGSGPARLEAPACVSPKKGHKNSPIAPRRVYPEDYDGVAEHSMGASRAISGQLPPTFSDTGSVEFRTLGKTLYWSTRASECGSCPVRTGKGSVASSHGSDNIPAHLQKGVRQKLVHVSAHTERHANTLPLRRLNAICTSPYGTSSSGTTASFPNHVDPFRVDANPNKLEGGVRQAQKDGANEKSRFTLGMHILTGCRISGNMWHELRVVLHNWDNTLLTRGVELESFYLKRFLLLQTCLVALRHMLLHTPAFRPATPGYTGDEPRQARPRLHSCSPLPDVGHHAK